MAAAVVLLGGLAFAGYHLYLNEVDDSAVELVPADAVFYANVFLNPSTRQKQALRDFLRHFPSVGTGDETTERIEESFDTVLEPLGLAYEDDVKPWLGRQLAVYAIAESQEQLQGAALIATKDADATRDAVEIASAEIDEDLQPRTYEGVAYDLARKSGSAVGVVGDFLVIASDTTAFEATVDARQGRSLDDTELFAQATRGLPTDRLALFFMNLEPVVASLRESGFTAPNVERALGSPAGAVAYLRPDEIVFEGSFPGEGGEPGEALARIPARASAALAIEDFGGFLLDQLEYVGPLGVAAADVALQEAVELDLEDDLLSWMGNLSFFLDFDDPDEPVVVVRIDSRSPEKSAGALSQLQIALIRQGIRMRPTDVGGLEGFWVEPPDATQRILVVDGGEAVTVGSSKEGALSALRPERTLGDDAQYKGAIDALGSGFSAGGFLRVAPILDLIGNELDESNLADVAMLDAFRPDLAPFSFIIYGSRPAGDRTHSRIVIGVE